MDNTDFLTLITRQSTFHILIFYQHEMYCLSKQETIKPVHWIYVCVTATNTLNCGYEHKERSLVFGLYIKIIGEVVHNKNGV